MDDISPTAPIIVLDSGVGGLSVAKAIRNLMPHEDILYFGDTARVPYGSKTAPTIVSFVSQIIEYLRPYEAKHVVLACNTATALALGAIRKRFAGLSISGVIEPGAKAAAEAAGAKPFPIIAVIGTEATIRSHAYETAICRRRQHARVISRATPLLVPIIEEGRRLDDPLVGMALEQYLRPLLDRGPDVLVLGCTHYPLLKDLIVQIAGPQVAVIDSADQCAQDVERRLQVAGILRGDTQQIGQMRCFVTDDSPRFPSLASRFLGFDISSPVWVPPEDLYATSLAPMDDLEVAATGGLDSTE